MGYVIPNTIDQDRLIAYLREKWGKSRRCPMCDVSAWSVYDHAYQLDEYNHGLLAPGFASGGRVLPVVPIICGNCGNTVLINALQAEVIKSTP
jgi:hypothetical protein